MAILHQTHQIVHFHRIKVDQEVGVGDVAEADLGVVAWIERDQRVTIDHTKISDIFTVEVDRVRDLVSVVISVDRGATVEIVVIVEIVVAVEITAATVALIVVVVGIEEVHINGLIEVQVAVVVVVEVKIVHLDQFLQKL